MKLCLYCGEICELIKDPKHPDRWKPAYPCRSTYAEHDDKPYKDFILDECDTHGDEWASEVRVRVLDLHAADARYHKDCMSRFFSHRNLQYDDSRTGNMSSVNNKALKEVFTTLRKDKTKI